MKILKTLFLARRSLGRVVPLMRDERVPAMLKMGTATAALLIISPLDIFGDIPALGFVDDGILLVLLLTWFVTRATRLIERTAAPVRDMVRVGPPALR